MNEEPLDPTPDEQEEVRDRRTARKAAQVIFHALDDFNAAQDRLVSLLMTHGARLRYQPRIEVPAIVRDELGEDLAVHLGKLDLRIALKGSEVHREPRGS